MRFRERAEKTAGAVTDGLGLELSETQAKGLADIIEKAIIAEAREERERCAVVAHHCCSADMDLAHKTAKQMYGGGSDIRSRIQLLDNGQTLNISGTHVSKSSVEILRKALPNCDIRLD